MLLSKEQQGGELIKRLIHSPYNRLKGFAVEKGIKYSDIAAVLGVTAATVSLKINGISDFYLNEQKLLEEKFAMTSDIFS